MWRFLCPARLYSGSHGGEIEVCSAAATLIPGEGELHAFTWKLLHQMKLLHLFNDAINEQVEAEPTDFKENVGDNIQWYAFLGQQRPSRSGLRYKLEFMHAKMFL